MKRFFLLGEKILKTGDEVFKKECFVTYGTNDQKRALGLIYSNPPDMIIADGDLEGLDLICKELKSDTIYGHIPILIIVQQDCVHKTNFENIWFDDFLLSPYENEELLWRVNLNIKRLVSALDSNPLTKLPGNTSILQTIQEYIDNEKEFALCYVDLDNFKPFNDRYGFSRGDEVLRLIARVISNVVRQATSGEGFVGHIGGDDFVFVVKPSQAEIVSKEIIFNFDELIPTFYDEDDRKAGYLEIKDRQDNIRKFLIVTLTIAIVTTDYGKLNHYGEVSAIAAELKKLGKKTTKSNYVIDKRLRNPDTK